MSGRYLFVMVPHEVLPAREWDQRERVFDRFVRIESDRARRVSGGTGLGLPIARGIAQRYGGTVVLNSDAAGTVVTLTMPRA